MRLSRKWNRLFRRVDMRRLWMHKFTRFSLNEAEIMHVAEHVIHSYRTGISNMNSLRGIG